MSKSNIKFYIRLHIWISSVIILLLVLGRLFVLADLSGLIYEIFGTEDNRYVALKIFLTVHLVAMVFTVMSVPLKDDKK